MKGVELVYQATEVPRAVTPKFDHSTYFHRLETTSLGTVIMATARIPSTQTFMKQYVGLTHDMLVTAILSLLLAARCYVFTINLAYTPSL